MLSAEYQQARPVIALMLWGAYGAAARLIYEWPEGTHLRRVIGRIMVGSFMSLQLAFAVWYTWFEGRPLWLFVLGGMGGMFGMDAVPLLVAVFAWVVKLPAAVIQVMMPRNGKDK